MVRATKSFLLLAGASFRRRELKFPKNEVQTVSGSGITRMHYVTLIPDDKN